MANLIRSRKGALEKTRSRSSPVVEELDPSSGWTADSDNHYLLIDLPHFKKEEIKIETERPDEVTISGERRVNDNKSVRFVKTYKVPEDGDTQRTSRKLEGRTLTLIIPKLPMGEKKDDQPEAEKVSTGNDVDDDAPHENPIRTKAEEPEEDEKEEEEGGVAQNEKESCYGSSNLFGRGIVVISKNRMTIFMAILAFSLGAFASKKFGSSL